MFYPVISYACTMIVMFAAGVCGLSLAFSWFEYGLDNEHKLLCVACIIFSVFLIIGITFR